MSKDSLAEAKSLIQQKRYQDARRILRKMDDETARRWLAKLDEIAPEADAAQPQSRLLFVPLIALLLVIGFIAGFFVGRGANQSEVLMPSPEAGIVQQPTEDCGARDWWNMNAGVVVDFMKNVGILAETEEVDTFIYPTLMDGLREKREKFNDAAYPLCAKDVHDLINKGMFAYIFGFSERQLNALGTEIDENTPEDYFAVASENMNLSAQMIADLTGMDASFLTEDGGL